MVVKCYTLTNSYIYRQSFRRLLFGEIYGSNLAHSVKDWRSRFTAASVGTTVVGGRSPSDGPETVSMEGALPSDGSGTATGRRDLPSDGAGARD